MSSASAVARSKEFNIIKYLDLEHDSDKTLVLVKRTSDGETLLGHLLGDSTKPEWFLDMFENGPAGNTLSRLLNHENLVSLAGVVPGAKAMDGNKRTASQPMQYLIFDHCDAGTLDNMIRTPPVPRTDTGFLPQSMCWHVLVSLLRALAWLHDGYREDDSDLQAGWFQDPDWLAVLHGNISPENIFFQRPRGSETYGLVKLGDFSHAHVAAHVHGSRGLLLGFKDENASFSELLVEYREGDFEQIPMEKLPYTRGSELQAVGAILYRMMAGKAIPPPGKCGEPGCGCYHRQAKARPCPHDCHEQVDLSTNEKCVELFSKLSDYHGLYRERDLDKLVGGLLAIDPWSSAPESTVLVYQSVKAAYEAWLADDPDGQRFVTLEEDLDDREARAWEKARKMV